MLQEMMLKCERGIACLWERVAFSNPIEGSKVFLFRKILADSQRYTMNFKLVDDAHERLQVSKSMKKTSFISAFAFSLPVNKMNGRAVSEKVKLTKAWHCLNTTRSSITKSSDSSKFEVVLLYCTIATVVTIRANLCLKQGISP